MARLQPAVMTVSPVPATPGIGWHCVTAQEGDFAADREQCAALAQRLKIVAVERFRFRYTLRPAPWPEVLRLQGQVQGRAVQECVATLAPVPQTINERFEVYCGPEAVLAQLMNEGRITDDDEPPEKMTAGLLDVSEVAVQYFALALDPYPRKQ
jgi:hypothetical protein